MNRPRILLTGATGQVGWELRRSLATLGEVVAPTREQLDLADAGAMVRLVREMSPRWIVNPAAYTAVDKAEGEREQVFRLNRDAPAAFAEAALEVGAGLIHFSTDYVYDGSKPEPYVESDPTGPLSVYGESKLAGEQAIRHSGVPHLIFRTSWVYGARGRNFLLTMSRLAREKPELSVVADQFGAPTWSRSLAEATAQVLSWLAPADLEAVGGTYHMTNAGSTSWYGFAEALLAAQGLSTPVKPIPTEAYPTPAKRPVNSRLSTDRLRHVFGIVMPDWRESLALCLDRDVPA